MIDNRDGWIDAHSHLHTLPWDHLDLMAMTGMQAAIITAGNPHVHNRFFEAPLTTSDLRELWDDAVNFASKIGRTHPFKIHVLVGIHMLARVADPEDSLKALEEYLERPEVIGLGEFGFDSTQYFGLSWTLDEQEAVIRGQLELAKRTGATVDLHTPTLKRPTEFLTEITPPSVDWREYKRPFIERTLKVIHDVGLDERQVVMDHIDDTVFDWVHDACDCWIGIEVGLALRHMRPKDLAEMVAEKNTSRIIIGSDLAGHVSYDPLALPKTLLEMRRLGVSEDVIDQVFRQNVTTAYGLANG